MKNTASIFSFISASVFLLVSGCTTIDLYEKAVSIPGHAWKSTYVPSFDFTIRDTASAYQLYVILRHNDRYNFNNIYINLGTKQPGPDSVKVVRYDLRLANDEGWLASGMDDIYEHRIPLTPVGQEFYFRKPGEYSFTIQQIMREDPLKNVLNVGLRLEKLP